MKDMTDINKKLKEMSEKYQLVIDVRCCNCKHWEEYRNGFGFGTCKDNLGEKVSIELITGWEGGYVDSIETESDFFCANFKEKK